MEASLVRRLAGPSTEKAGLSKDQTEINRIIAEASKGSAFFENEKRKDKELTEKIARLLKHRDNVLRGIDQGRLEASIDKTLVHLEAKRDLTQYIVHVDMDAFFAAVELLDDPSLKGKPFGVGKGVLTTASYEARSYGVRSGMAGFIAKKLCPQLILLRIRPDRYGAMSRKVMDVFRRYDPNMLVAGTDEAYLNITQYCQMNGLSPNDCVHRLRTDVHAETSLTVSAGIAPNKMLAKICSDKNKPNGQFYLPFERDAIVAFMHDLPIRKIPGIGRVTERLLDSIDVKTCGDILKHRATLSVLDKQFHLRSLLLIHLGIASNDVRPGQREERKSVGSERTFSPISDEREILAKLESCAADLEEDLGRTAWAGKTITLKYKLDNFQVFTRAKSSTRYLNRKDDLFSIGKNLLMPKLPLTIRLIGLRVTKLKDLRASDGQGLKRFTQFFEADQGSPSKKRSKLDHKADETHEMSEHVFEEEDGQAMTEYEDDFDEQVTVDGDDRAAVELSGLVTSSVKPRTHNPLHSTSLKPKSTSAMSTTSPSAAHAEATTRTSSLLASNGKLEENLPKFKKMRVTSAPMEARQVCPICSKDFDTDNVGLNNHIDFCLSKGAILAATAVPHGRSLTVKTRRTK